MVWRNENKRIYRKHRKKPQERRRVGGWMDEWVAGREGCRKVAKVEEEHGKEGEKECVRGEKIL